MASMSFYNKINELSGQRTYLFEKLTEIIAQIKTEYDAAGIDYDPMFELREEIDKMIKTVGIQEIPATPPEEDDYYESSDFEESDD